ncbi:MAG: aminotransferase class III-fold pyridoxal phosphate-dependent enzyme, partial [Nitrospinaceae bacterium]|nr:aminotransferase class III-fold pyridoxal phosphate-dependent enzyme [Nitrospinaceae bacterium]
MDLKDIDRRYVWHPFTQMKDYENDEPLIIERGEGVYLIDIDGNRYIDGVSSLWVNIHGHAHPIINKAIHEQVNRISHSTLLGISNRPAVELAKRLVDVAPEGRTKVFYSDNGSTSVEIGIKMAYQFWQQLGFPRKKKFISLAQGYHGDTIGSVSLGGIDLFHKIYGPLLFHVEKAPSYSCYRCQLGLEYPACELACAAEMERLIEEHSEELCAVVMEPLVQGAG